MITVYLAVARREFLWLADRVETQFPVIPNARKGDNTFRRGEGSLYLYTERINVIFEEKIWNHNSIITIILQLASANKMQIRDERISVSELKFGLKDSFASSV